MPIVAFNATNGAAEISTQKLFRKRNCTETVETMETNVITG